MDPSERGKKKCAIKERTLKPGKEIRREQSLEAAEKKRKEKKRRKKHPPIPRQSKLKNNENFFSFLTLTVCSYSRM
jgi:hypothetical protein